MTSKCVMQSIQPQYCELIVSGKKTIEVRKSRPKLETPFKCYINCTSVKSMNLKQYCAVHAKTGGLVDDWSGKVIGEYICEQIYQYSTGNIEGQTISGEEMQRQSCLTYDDLCRYECGAEPKENRIYLIGLYGWHISDLKIYDKPKELSEFYKDCGENPQCEGCGYRYVESNESVGFYEGCCSKYERYKPIMRPPQSWFYVWGNI